jgi:uncharacterized protein (TIGR02246 family)
MKMIFLFLLIKGCSITSFAQNDENGELVKRVIDSFYHGFRTDNFRNMSGYATDDINYIAPTGSWFRGRKQLQDSIQYVHDGMLKNTPIEIETLTIRFITPDVAIVNLVDKMGPFFPPDGKDRGNNKVASMRTARTMVVVKQNGKWMLTQNQSTFIGQ